MAFSWVSILRRGSRETWRSRSGLAAEAAEKGESMIQYAKRSRNLVGILPEWLTGSPAGFGPDRCFFFYTPTIVIFAHSVLPIPFGHGSCDL